MGFYIGALDPKRRAKKYLEFNMAGWHALWPYICERCNDILTEKDQEMGLFNNGYVIRGKKAQRIYERIQSDLKGMTPFHPQYGFSRDDLKELAQFIRDSGGFEIC